MGKKIIDDGTLTNIADAIRGKTGGTAQITPVEMPGAIAGISTGAGLPELSNPGTAADLASGKELIDGQGNVVTGSVTEKTSGYSFTQNSSLTYDSAKESIVAEYTFLNDYLFRAGSKIKLQTYGEMYGNATTADVVKGKTFTSAAGLRVTGTMVPAVNPIKIVDSLNMNNFTSTIQSFSKLASEGNAVILTRKTDGAKIFLSYDAQYLDVSSLTPYTYTVNIDPSFTSFETVGLGYYSVSDKVLCFTCGDAYDIKNAFSKIEMAMITL